MPKFYGQNKKRIDPRYFLEETIDQEEHDDAMARAEMTDVEPGKERPPWEDPDSPSDPMARAKGLAQQGLEGKERPPWEDPDSPSDPMARAKGLAQQGLEQAQGADPGILDGQLEDGTSLIDVVQMVRKQLNIPGGQSTLEKFDQMLAEMGVELGHAPVAGSGIDVPESEAELDVSGQNAKQPDPIM